MIYRFAFRLFGFFMGSFLLMGSHVYADNLFGEFKRLPDAIERGFSIGTDFGLLFLTDGEATNPGFALSFTTGYDLGRYLCLEGLYSLGINEAPQNDPVLQGGVYTVIVDMALKGQLPLGRWYPFVELGGGIHHSQPNLEIDKNNKINLLLAGGVEYFTYLRHYSLYTKATFFYIMDVNPNIFTISAGVKYTF